MKDLQKHKPSHRRCTQSELNEGPPRAYLTSALDHRSFVLRYLHRSVEAASGQFLHVLTRARLRAVHEYGDTSVAGAVAACAHAALLCGDARVYAVAYACLIHVKNAHVKPYV